MAWNNCQDPHFTTATILEWRHLLKNEDCKTIITDSLAFIRKEERAYVHAFVIMPNHIHLLWSIPGTHDLTEVKSALISWTAHEFKKRLRQKHPAVLEQF